MQPGAAILLDLDGTLMDPREGILGCFRYALERVGAGVLTDRELEAFIGPPLHESLAGLIGADSVRVTDAISFYRERFTARGMFENRVYPGITQALAEMQQSGLRLFVATSKPQSFTDRIVDHFDLRKYFRGIYGSELDGSRSKKNDLIAHVLESEALNSLNTAMIGDRAQDMVGAKANAVFPIGALWGYGSQDELVSGGASALCEHPSRLWATVSFYYPFNPTRAG
jgi:phosphoglycolate phosphatase